MSLSESEKHYRPMQRNGFLHLLNMQLGKLNKNKNEYEMEIIHLNTQ